MPDSERTFKIKGRPRWTVVKILLMPAVICMETRLSNFLKTTTVTKLTKAILESSYRARQVKSKWKLLMQTGYFLRVVEFWPTFDMEIDISLAILWEKLQNYTF